MLLFCLKINKQIQPLPALNMSYLFWATQYGIIILLWFNKQTSFIFQLLNSNVEVTVIVETLNKNGSGIWMR